MRNQRRSNPPPSIVSSSVRTRDYLTTLEIDALMAAARQSSRYGHRDATMILLGYRHGLRAAAPAWLRLCPSQCGSRHPCLASLARAQEYPAHRTLHGASSGSVQEFLALTNGDTGPRDRSPGWGRINGSHPPPTSLRFSLRTPYLLRRSALRPAAGVRVTAITERPTVRPNIVNMELGQFSKKISNVEDNLRFQPRMKINP